MPSKKKDPILVVLIRNGVVDEAKLFTDVKRAEECFTLVCLDLGARKDHMDKHLDDGYYQDLKCSTVCLTHPEIL
jgi:hypothetical protein